MGHEIVFTGRLRDGVTADQVRANFSRLFRISDEKTLSHIFSGSPVVLKKGVAAEQARQYMMVLFKAGAMCELRAVGGAPPDQDVPHANIATGAFVVALQNTTATLIPVAPRAPMPVAAAPALALAAPTGEPELSMVAEPVPPPVLTLAPAAAVPADPEAPAFDPFSVKKVKDDGGPEEWEVGSPLPQVAEGLCWAGFLAPFLWGTFNGMVFSFAPLLLIRVLKDWLPTWMWIVFYFGFGTFYLLKGRELAWMNKRWRDVDHFMRVQRYWTIGSGVFCAVFMVSIVNLIQYDLQIERQIAAMDALVVAEAIEDPDERKAAVATARVEYLDSLTDPQERKDAEQAFAEDDQYAAEMEAQEEAEAQWQADMEAGGMPTDEPED